MKLPRFRYALVLALGFGLVTNTPATAADVPTSFTITGSGNGHGVGLSQYGAQGLAAYSGKTAEEILTYFYQGTTVSDYDYTANQNIKVNLDGDEPFMYLRFEDDPSNTNAVAAAPTITIGGVQVSGITYDTDYTFALTGTSFSLSGSGISTTTGTTASIAWDNNSSLVNINGGPVGSSAVGMLGVVGSCSTTNCVHRYKYGTVDIFVSQLKAGVVVTQDLQATATMKLNSEYLYGIGEVPSSWATEALKAQAIAARTYATRKQLDFPAADRDDCGCQIFSSTIDQNYVGFSKEYLASGSNWVAAVNATINATDPALVKGKVVLSGTDVITAYYTASTGGKTQPKNEWGNGSATYLVSVDDPYSLDARVGNSRASWSVNIDQATLVSRLAGQGVSVANVASIAITEKYASGGVKKLTFTDSNGTATVLTIAPGQPVTPDELRTLLGTYSTYLSNITWTPVTPTPSTTPTPEPTTAAPAPAAPAPAPAAPSVSTPSATAKKKVKSITSVSWQSNKVKKSRAVVTGKVSPVMSGVSVALQVKRNSGWVTVATDKTGAKGAWALNWSSISTGTHQVRIVAASAVNTVSTGTKKLKVTQVL